MTRAKWVSLLKVSELYLARMCVKWVILAGGMAGIKMFGDMGYPKAVAYLLIMWVVALIYLWIWQWIPFYNYFKHRETPMKNDLCRGCHDFTVACFNKPCERSLK